MHLPAWAPMAGITIFGRVFVKRGVHPVVLLHEAVHARQQAEDGWRFYVRYCFSRAWRARYEAEAYAVSVQHGATLDGCVRHLSGPLYLWCCSAAEARRLILEAL